MFKDSAYRVDINIELENGIYGFDTISATGKTLEAIDLYGGSTKEEYEALTKLYQIYIKIGGYPRVVKEYSHTHSIENCYKLLENLLITFTNESSSYFNNDEYNRSMSIFENVYTELYRLYKSHKLKGDKPSYSIYNNYELDFMLIDKNDKTYEIEVKSSNSNKFKSIKEYTNRGLIDEAYVVEVTRGGKSSKLENLSKIPVYTVGCRFPY